MSTGADASDLELELGPGEALSLYRPELPPLSEVARYYALAEDARVYSGGGPCNERVSARLAAYAGAGACVPVANGTLGLVVALCEAAGRRCARRLVVTPAFAPASTACAIRAAGLEPLFVDVDPDAWQLEPDALELALTRHGRAVACVLARSAFGTAAPSGIRQRWRELTASHGVPLVIDSAAAFGAVDDEGTLLGGQAEAEVFSFGSTLPFAIGEGGAICTPDPDRAARLAQIGSGGVDAGGGGASLAGINARMSELAAATALAMLDRFVDVLARRRGTAGQLQAVMAGLPLAYQRGVEGSTWPAFQVLVGEAAVRCRALAKAQELKVEVRTCFDPPLHRHPAFAGAPRAGSLAVSEDLAARSLTLPIANSLGPRQVIRLAELAEGMFS